MNEPKPKLPDGWHDHPSRAFDYNPPKDREVECGCCNWKGLESEMHKPLEECSALWERLTPGHEVPAGECAECFSFCYYADIQIAYRRKPNILEWIAEEV